MPWRSSPTTRDAAEELLTGAADELTQAIDELRELARGIHPAVLTDRGLPAALEALAAGLAVPVELSTQLDERLPGPVEAAAYYVVSEALDERGQVRRGAPPSTSVPSARTVECSSRSPTTASAGPTRHAGSGLRGLADRVESLDGRLEIESAGRGGTRITAVIPLVG